MGKTIADAIPWKNLIPDNSRTEPAGTYSREKTRYKKSPVMMNFLLPFTSENLPKKGMALDLGGLAKGTIIDAAATHLKSSGIKTAAYSEVKTDR